MTQGSARSCVSIHHGFSLCHSRAKRRIPESFFFGLFFESTLTPAFLCRSARSPRVLYHSTEVLLCFIPSGAPSLCHSRAESAERRIPVLVSAVGLSFIHSPAWSEDSRFLSLHFG